MNWTFEYSKNANFVRVNEEGSFNLKDNSRKMDELAVQYSLEHGLKILFDSRKLDLTEMDQDAVRLLADNFVKDDRFIGCDRIAILVRAVVDYGRGRQFEMLTDEKTPTDIRIFLDEKQALQWLKG